MLRDQRPGAEPEGSRSGEREPDRPSLRAERRDRPAETLNEAGGRFSAAVLRRTREPFEFVEEPAARAAEIRLRSTLSGPLILFVGVPSIAHRAGLIASRLLEPLALRDEPPARNALLLKIIQLRLLGSDLPERVFLLVVQLRVIVHRALHIRL